MSLDAATEYLIRKDKKALQKRLKKNERTLSVIQARWHEQVGLLAATGKRLLFIFKAGLRYRTVEIARSELQQLTEFRGRPTAIVATTKKGTKHRFEMLQHGAAEVFIEKVNPATKLNTGRSQQTRKDGPMVFKPSKPVQQPAPTAKPSHPTRGRGDAALSATQADKLARLESLYKGGQISKGEYEWQRDALQR